MNINKLLLYDYTVNNQKITQIKSQIHKYIISNNNTLKTNVNINTHDSTLLTYLTTYNSNNTINHYYYFFYNYLVNTIDYKNSIGIDYGCWAGLSSIILSSFGCNKIYSFDFFPKEVIYNVINNIQPNSNIIYNNIIDINIIDEKIDWIVIYDVLCDFKTDGDIIKDFTEKIIYFYNILNNNGILLIADFESNSKIKINKLIELLYRFKINLYYNNDNGRFVIKAIKY
jgi:hypothetical protein